MSEFKIEKKIPMPKKRIGKYPFDNMSVGDSFLVKLEDSGCKNLQHLQVSLASAAKCWIIYHEKIGYKFSTHQEDGGVRIWRTK